MELRILYEVTHKKLRFYACGYAYYGQPLYGWQTETEVGWFMDLWTIRSQDCSFPGLFVQWTARTLDHSFHLHCFVLQVFGMAIMTKL